MVKIAYLEWWQLVTMTTPAMSPYICIFVLKPDSQQNPEQGALIHRKNRKKWNYYF